MINVNFILAQVLGVVTTLIMCLCYTVKSKKTFLLLGFTGDIIYGTTFLFVGSLSAGIIALISCVQGLFLYFLSKKNKRPPKIIALVFITAFIIVGIKTMESYWDIIPMFNYSLFTFALYLDNVKAIKFMYIIPNALQTIYDFIVMAYASALEDGFEAIYLAVVMVVSYIKAKKNSKVITNDATQTDSSSNIIMRRGFGPKFLQSDIIKDEVVFNSKIIKGWLRTISVKELHPPSMVASCHN